MKYFFDAFAGYGGFSLGIKQAYEDISNKQPTSIKQNRQGRNRTIDEMGDNVLSSSRATPLCVGFSEIDKYAIQIYEKHFGNRRDTKERSENDKSESSTNRSDGKRRRTYSNNNGHKNYGDITKINPEELPDFDLFCGGVPCQSWSIAGKRGGFEDPRGNMWFESIKIIRAKKPKYFLLENVKGLLSHDGGKSMERICEELCESGYAIDFEVLNAKNFGVPQNRERVFIIGIRLDLLDECQIF